MIKEKREEVTIEDIKSSLGFYINEMLNNGRGDVAEYIPELIDTYREM